jgi:hypothetical protein
MSMESTLQALLVEAIPPLRGALQRAFETGYREGLASTGAAREAAPFDGTRAPIAAAPPAADTELLDWDDDLEPVDSAPPPASQDMARDDDSSPADGIAETRPAVDWGSGQRDRSPGRVEAPRAGIFPHASVGTLRARIIEFFGLERFQIDVVICRKGDRTRRQLKQSVKLSKYLVEG